MPDRADFFGYAAGALALFAYIPYTISILQNKTKPNRATWIIWAILDVLALFSYYVSGARETLWVPLGFTLGSIVVVAFSIKYGEKHWSRLDIFCLAGAGISIPIWLMSSALNALLINLFVTAVGALPTFRKTYRDPQSENKLAWGLFMVSCVANILAVREWKFAIYIYPITILLIDGPIAAVVFWPRKTPKEA